MSFDLGIAKAQIQKTPSNVAKAKTKNKTPPMNPT